MGRLWCAALISLLSSMALAQVPAQVPGRTVTVLMVGDSTMEGLTCVSDPCLPFSAATYAVAPHNEAASIQTLADADFGVGVVTVINGGVGGSTCRDWWYGPAGGTDKVASSWPQMLAADPRFRAAAIIVNNCGLNDWGLMTANGGAEQPADLLYQINQMVYATQVAGKTYVIETPNPVANSKYNPGVAIMARQHVTAAVEHGTWVVNQFDYDQTIPGWQVMLPDAIHPNDALYRAKANLTYSTALKPLIAWYLTHP